MWPTILFSLGLLSLSLGLLAAHWRSWQRERLATAEDSRQHDFARCQFRRRMQASAMIGLVAVAILISPWVADPHDHSPLFSLFYWAGILAVVGWVLLLALADVAHTRWHFGQVQQDRLTEEADLQADLRRARNEADDERP